MTRLQLTERLALNLNDQDMTFWTDDDINASIQDAYDDVVGNSQCLINSGTVNFVSDRTYYRWTEMGIATDVLATIAIFNNNNNIFIEDSLSLRDMDRFRSDWEIWNGNPQYWFPVCFDCIGLAPKYLIATGNFTHYYWKRAVGLTSDSDVFDVSRNALQLLEHYSTADLLEQAEEYTKAARWWEPYFLELEKMKMQSMNLARANFMQRQ